MHTLPISWLVTIPGYWVRLLALTMLASSCALVAANANTLAQARQQGQLVIAIDQVAAPYTGGDKFRTPERLDSMLAEELAKRFQVKLVTQTKPTQHNQLPSASGPDLLLTSVVDHAPLNRAANIIPTGYSTGPMAIMRSDTTIKTWAQLKGRIVCVAKDGRHAGVAAQYGAIEQVYKAPADSLLALRTGACDAAIHDSTLLEELIRLPEWKKFSARLPVGPRHSLVIVVPNNDVTTARLLKRAVAEWRASNYLNQLTAKSARNIAFEVYLDQTVPDCH